MSRIDLRTRTYLKDNARFADIINFHMYGGDQVVKPDDLHEVDAVEIVFPHAEKGKSEVIQRYRDVIKNVSARTDDNTIYMIVGIENQAEIQYAMPVKNMLYDAENFARQVQAIAKGHRDDKYEKVTSGEFLSGFYKNDRLVPVITIVVLWSPDKWDGPMSLHDMMDISNPEVLKFVPNYAINLVSPYDMDDDEFAMFRTTMAEVMKFIKYSKDKHALLNVVGSDDVYKHLDRETAELLSDVTGTRVEFDEGEEVINMCKAIDDLMSDARVEGIEEGKIEGKKEGRKEGRKEGIFQTTLKNLRSLMETTGFNIEQAMNALKVPEKDRAMYMSKI